MARKVTKKKPAKPKPAQTKKPTPAPKRAPPTDNEILDVAQAAEALGLSSRIVVNLVRTGELPGRKIGRFWRFHRSVIREWLSQPDTTDVAKALKDPRVKVRAGR